MKKKLIVLVLLILVAAGGAAWYLRNPSHGTPGAIHVSGNIELTDVSLSFKIAGRVQERLVDEGNTVVTGQKVAVLDSSDLQQQVLLRKAEVQAAEANLAQFVAGSRPQEIQQAEASARSSEADLKLARQNYERAKNLFDQQVVSARDLDSAKAALDVAQARLQEAQEQLKLVREGPRKEQIDQARATLQSSREALALAETTLGYATLYSPLSGVVLSKSTEAGEYVIAGTPLVSVGDLHSVWLRAYIPETDLGRVKIGQKARISTDTYPGKSYEGRVSFIASQAEFTPKNVQTETERVKLVYRIKIDLANPNLELKPGMPADGEIEGAP